MTKPKLVTKKDLEFISNTAGDLAHKVRLLGHMKRIRSSPEFRAMERERRRAQKHQQELARQRAARRADLEQHSSDA